MAFTEAVNKISGFLRQASGTSRAAVMKGWATGRSEVTNALRHGASYWTHPVMLEAKGIAGRMASTGGGYAKSVWNNSGSLKSLGIKAGMGAGVGALGGAGYSYADRGRVNSSTVARGAVIGAIGGLGYGMYGGIRKTALPSGMLDEARAFGGRMRNSPGYAKGRGFVRTGGSAPSYYGAARANKGQLLLGDGGTVRGGYNAELAERARQIVVERSSSARVL